MSHSPGLFDGPFGPANQVLLLALDPEMRGIIRQVREDGNERPPRKRLIEALSKCTVEMGNQRNDHVWVGLKPEGLEHLNRRIVIQTHGKLQDAQKLRATKRPAVPEHLVIEVLNSKAGELPKNVQGVKYFLKVYKRDFERKALAFDFNLQGSGGVPMPSAGVKENK
jgi:hypothetical protein